MKTPQGLQALIDDGVIDAVVRPLKSGKEAAVYVVRSGTFKSISVSREGHSKITGFYLPGDVLGLHAIAEGVCGFDAMTSLPAPSLRIPISSSSPRKRGPSRLPLWPG